LNTTALEETSIGAAETAINNVTHLPDVRKERPTNAELKIRERNSASSIRIQLSFSRYTQVHNEFIFNTI
jgi:hypothetical protein